MLSKTLVTAVVLSCALLVTHSYARAESPAEDAYNKALDACAVKQEGQRSFCFIEAHDKYKAAMGEEQKYDYSDTSNDTPAQTKAKAAYGQAADACADLNKGQRSFCMENAHEAYMQAMGLAPK